MCAALRVDNLGRIGITGVELEDLLAGGEAGVPGGGLPWIAGGGAGVLGRSGGVLVGLLSGS